MASFNCYFCHKQKWQLKLTFFAYFNHNLMVLQITKLTIIIAINRFVSPLTSVIVPIMEKSSECRALETSIGTYNLDRKKFHSWPKMLQS